MLRRFVRIALSSLALAAAVPALARAETSGTISTDDKQLGRRLQELLRERGDAIYGCWNKALAEKPGLAGELLMRIWIGPAPEGRVLRAEILKDQVGSPTLAGCLVDQALRWSAPGLAGGEIRQVVFPLVFKAEGKTTPPPTPAPAPAPSTTPTPSTTTSPTTPPAAAERPAPVYPTRYVVPLKDGRPGPLGTGRVDARVLLDAETVGATSASMTYLTLRPLARLTLHTHPGAAEIFYVTKGIARVRGPKGGAPEIAETGDVIVSPAGAAHSLEAAPFSPMVAVQIFTPAGPERAYKNPAERGGTLPLGKRRGGDPKIVPRIIHASSIKELSILDGKGSAQLFLDGIDAGVSLQRLEAAAGATIPTHVHEGADELLYVLQGRGEMTVGEERLAVAAGDAIHLPRGVAHGIRVDEKLVAVQVYAPGGPEQRFKGGAAAVAPVAPVAATEPAPSIEEPKPTAKAKAGKGRSRRGGAGGKGTSK